MRESVVFYRSFYEAFKDLDIELRCKLYEAIFEYGMNGELPDLSPVENAFFVLVKPQIDANNIRYENGKMGGRPKTKQEPNNNQEETKSKPNNNQTITNNKPNQNQVEPNVNVKGNVNGNVKEECRMYNDNEELNIRSNKLLLCPTQELNKEKINYQELVNWVNSKFGNIYCNIRLPLSDKRKKMIAARIRDYDKNGFCEAVIKAVESKYLREQTWFNFDWMIKPTNFEKLISGNYDNKQTEKSIANDTGLAEAIQRGITRARNKAPGSL